MNRKPGAFSVVLSVSVLAVLTMLVFPAHAARVRVCPSMDTWTFNPALDTDFEDHTATNNWNSPFCYNAAATVPSLPDIHLYPEGAISGSTPADSFGNCALLLTSPPMNGVIIGGIVAVNVDTGNPIVARQKVIVPDNVCNQAGGSGAGLTEFVFTS